MPRNPTPLLVRIRRRLVRDVATGCLLWTGATSDFGHGVIGRGARGTGLVRVHRAIWEDERGPIPDGLFVLHACDVPPCCEVEHLFLGTALDNARDMAAKGRASTPAARLDADDVRAVREMKQRGDLNRVIAERFHIGNRHVRRIAAREQWKHVLAA